MAWIYLTAAWRFTVHWEVVRTRLQKGMIWGLTLYPEDLKALKVGFDVGSKPVPRTAGAGAKTKLPKWLTPCWREEDLILFLGLWVIEEVPERSSDTDYHLCWLATSLAPQFPYPQYCCYNHILPVHSDVLYSVSNMPRFISLCMFGSRNEGWRIKERGTTCLDCCPSTFHYCAEWVLLLSPQLFFQYLGLWKTWNFSLHLQADLLSAQRSFCLSLCGYPAVASLCTENPDPGKRARRQFLTPSQTQIILSLWPD